MNNKLRLYREMMHQAQVHLFKKETKQARLLLQSMLSMRSKFLDDGPEGLAFLHRSRKAIVTLIMDISKEEMKK